MMPQPVAMTLLLLAGVALGFVFFGGLWFTVRALPTARYPTALAVASFWGRTALIVCAFAYLFSRNWQSVLVCVAGFVAARLLVARWIPKRPAAGNMAE
jgi:F1F0 ATPase subunit 2